MHEAVARHPMYKALASQVVGRPEAQVLQVIAKNVFGMTTHDEESEHVQRTDDDSQGVFKVLVEDKSTNCGANAAFSRNLLERNGIYKPRTIIVAQDPTMCRRTVASFQKTYEDELARPTILSWPTFVPRVGVADEGSAGATGKDTLGQLGYQPSRNTTGDADDLWDMERFVDLIMGEVPRLRDDECGYGPCGKGFITHVDVPQQVDEAWDRLRLSLGVTERTV